MIYGVTTGFGDSCTVAIQPELVAELPHHLYTFHGCGLGEYLTPAQTRAVIATRLTSLCKGFSGVSVELAGADRAPARRRPAAADSVRRLGRRQRRSDAAVLSRRGAVRRRRSVARRRQVPAAAALAEAGITPLRLRPKEGLAIMNGTAVMTALACLAYARAEYLTRLTTRITAMASFALDGNAEHFDETLFSVKPHPGQQAVAGWLRQDLPVRQAAAQRQAPAGPLFDPLRAACDRRARRCAAVAALVHRKRTQQRQRQSDHRCRRRAGAAWRPFLRRPHRLRHGQHEKRRGQPGRSARPADGACWSTAATATACRPISPASTGPRAAINHGLKALQISVSAWTAEALKLTMPASVFSRSTECHNQDKVSMGTIAARDCLRVLELTEQVAAGLLITVRQGVWLRCRLNPSALPQAQRSKRMIDALGADIAVIEEDRRLEPDLRLLLERIRSRAWKLYE